MISNDKNEIFIGRANVIHGGVYDYSKTDYKNSKTKVIIICNKHGEFWQCPSDHIHGKNGCPKCAKNYKLTQKNFVYESNIKHNYKYDYSKTVYINRDTKVVIICPHHGEFEQLAGIHYNGSGCPKCANENLSKIKMISGIEIINRFENVHGSIFDYSKVNYTGLYKKVIIICRSHGEFEQTPNDHLHHKVGCPQCFRDSILNQEKLIMRANFVHDYKYSYDKTRYKDTATKIIIICPTHGEFEQLPYDHLKGKGCAICSGNIKKTNYSFITESNIVHEYKYDYSKTNYINNSTKVIIICPIHGEFEQNPKDHLIVGNGCQKCGYIISALKHILSDDEFKSRAKTVHKNRYSYDKTIYTGINNKVIITCPHHGDFYQRPASHLHSKNGCPKCGHIISRKEIEWLDLMGIPEEFRQYPLKINNKKIIVDGYDADSNTIYEFYGDFWHGNPEKFAAHDINAATGTTFGELYKNTMAREEIIKLAEFNLVTIWEQDF